MAHFGVVAPPFYSHLEALQGLAAALLARGHQVTFLQCCDVGPLIIQPGVAFVALGRASHPAGSLRGILRRAANPGNPLGLHRVIEDMARTTAMLCQELPTVIERLAIDALICDQMEAAGALAAQALGLPYVSVACALPINREPGLPLPVMPFAFAQDARAHKLYAGSRAVHDWLMRPLHRTIDSQARRLGLGSREGLHDCLSPLAQLAQTIPGFDFPRQQAPDCLHEVGPLRRDSPAQALPWPVEHGRPLVFASLGTLQGHRLGLFMRIAEACRRADVQLLVAHCGGLDNQQVRRLLGAGASWVTAFAPLPALLPQAQVVISHGGLNTVMEAIAGSVPILALPIAFDQHGVAARVQQAGIGLRSSRHASATTLARHLRALLAWSPEQNRVLCERLAQAGGSARAAHIVETVARERRPVLREAVS